jgi:hypothetical protein
MAETKVCPECGARETRGTVLHRPLDADWNEAKRTKPVGAGVYEAVVRDWLEASVPGVPVYPLSPTAMGRKGGQARAANLSPEARSESARKAAKARWGKRPECGKTGWDGETDNCHLPEGHSGPHDWEG